MAATIALLGMLFIPLLLSTPTLTSATLTNATMLALRDGLMAHANRDLAPGAYPLIMPCLRSLIRYSIFAIHHSPFAVRHSSYEARAEE